MTAEERLAYFQGEKKRTPVYREEKKERNFDKIIFKFKFFVAVLLFVVFLSLDYTGYDIKGIDSERIIQEVTKDFKFLNEWNL